MTKWNKFWKDFENLFESMEGAMDDFSSSTNTQVMNGNGTSVVTKNGHVEIKGNIKSLKVNGKVIKLNE